LPVGNEANKASDLLAIERPDRRRINSAYTRGPKPTAAHSRVIRDLFDPLIVVATKNGQAAAVFLRDGPVV
jgi:hypothetical protein